MKNLFDTPILADAESEYTETLYSQGDFSFPGGFLLERILSFGAVTPEGEWYDQAWSEWVAVIRGDAVLDYADGTSVVMKEGDYLIIKPHVLHRVAHTSPDCIWLALHYHS